MDEFALVVVLVCLIGLVWLFPLVALPLAALEYGLTAGGVFLSLLLIGVFYALRKDKTGN